MDNTDIKILSCLTKNARANASEIAETVDLSVSAIIERIKKLENNGTILGYTAILNPQTIGKEISAIVSVGLEHTKYNESFLDTVKANPNVLECILITGEYDYNIKVVAENMPALEKVLYELKGNEGVSKFKTSIIVSTIKNEKSPLLSLKPNKPSK
ncbi:MAG: Lrp/AsnC family transcriptional regulator [Clostridia bacterium]